MIKLQIGHQAASYQTFGLAIPPFEKWNMSRWFFAHSSYWLVPKFSGEHFDVPLVASDVFFQSEVLLTYSSLLDVGVMSHVEDTCSLVWYYKPHSVQFLAISFNMFLVLCGFHGPLSPLAPLAFRSGYPPVLYTDFLSMLRLGDRWWIVAKSSDGEAFPKWSTVVKVFWANRTQSIQSKHFQDLLQQRVKEAALCSWVMSLSVLPWCLEEILQHLGCKKPWK